MKKKILMIALAACLITLSIAGSSLAYFTDTDAKTNVFTSGNVNILLTYDESNDPTKLFPGDTCNKPASIENTGSESAFVGAIIDVALPSGVTTSLNFEDIAGIFNGLDLDEVKYEATANGYKIYVVVGELAADAEPVTIFTGMTIPTAWNHAEMAIFKDMTVTVTGYAVQTVGLNNADTALPAVFDAWANFPSL